MVRGEKPGHGGFSGPLLLGVLYDTTGTFVPGLSFLAALVLAVAGITLFMRPER